MLVFCYSGITILLFVISSILKTTASYILSNLLIASGEREKPVPGLDLVPRCYSILVGGKSLYYILSLENFLKASGTLDCANPSGLLSGQVKGCFLKRASQVTTGTQSHSRRDGGLCFFWLLLSLCLLSLDSDYYFTFCGQ